MPSEPFAIYRVPDDAPANAEAMGTKFKFWFARDDAMWLFKATRPGHGEHWAEVLAAELASKLGLPHAQYELARWRDTVGVVTPRFNPEGFDLVHGNELLAEGDPSYPREGARYVRTREHTIAAVKSVLSEGVGLPLGWDAPAGVQSAADVFAGYLLLDAWVGNTDRHHENWGLVVSLSEKKAHLAPTFDHASSLGAHETDTVRSSRLESRDPGFRVDAYVRRPKVRSALYLAAGDRYPLGLIEAFSTWSQDTHSGPWLERLAGIGDGDIQDLVSRVPASEATGPALAFARAILEANKRRIMESR